MSYSRLSSMSPAELNQFIQEKSQSFFISRGDVELLREARQLRAALQQVAQYEEKDHSRTLEALQTKAYNLAGDLKKFDKTNTLQEYFDLIDGLVAVAKEDRNVSQLNLHIQQMESALASHKQIAELLKQSTSIHKSLCLLKEREAEIDPEKQQRQALFSAEDQTKRDALINHIKKCVAKLNQMDRNECKAAEKPILIKHRPVNHLYLENLFGLNKYFQQLKLEYDVRTGKVKAYENKSILFSPAPRIAGKTVSDYLLEEVNPTLSM